MPRSFKLDHHKCFYLIWTLGKVWRQRNALLGWSSLSFCLLSVSLCTSLQYDRDADDDVDNDNINDSVEMRILKLRKDEPPSHWALEETETKWYTLVDIVIPVRGMSRIIAPLKKCPVCWAPIQTVLLHKAVSPGSTWDSHPQLIVFQVRPLWHHHHHQDFIIAIIIHVQITAHVLAYTNSCLNPLLYAKMSNNFRRGFSQVNSVCFSCDS